MCHKILNIIKSFELNDTNLNITKSKINKLKYIIISNGLEYLRSNINNAIVSDTTEACIEDYCKKQVIQIVKNSSLDDSLKEIIVKRFGFLDGKYHTLDEIAEECGVTRERIRQKESKALRMLKNSSYAKQLKDLI